MTTTTPIAEVISDGGRDGSVETAQEGFRLEFRKPAGPSDQGLTPEHLFGAAWAACFHGALKHIATQRGFELPGSTVTARVHAQPNGNSKPFAVELSVAMPGVDEDDGVRLLEAAHRVCAYTAVTRDHVDLKTTLD